jgi:hypothetical protein
MAQFTVRVELHRAADADYETLHDAMERRGFSRTITSDRAIDYHLPTAEYDIAGEYTRAAILEMAKAAADETNKKYGVLVTEAVGRSWSGLERI